MQTNKQIYIFEQKLLNFINDSNLQVGVVYYVLKSLLKEIELIYIKSIELENNSIETVEQTYTAEPEELLGEKGDNE